MLTLTAGSSLESRRWVRYPPVPAPAPVPPPAPSPSPAPPSPAPAMCQTWPTRVLTQAIWSFAREEETQSGRLANSWIQSVVCKESANCSTLCCKLYRDRIHGVWDPLPELIIISPYYIDSRVNSNASIMGNSMPESTLTLCQSRLYLPVKFLFIVVIVKLCTRFWLQNPSSLNQSSNKGLGSQPQMQVKKN